MTRLPIVSGQECMRALQRTGFVVRRQRGSHIIMQREDPYGLVSIPNHREVKLGTLRKIIKDAGLTVEEFVNLL